MIKKNTKVIFVDGETFELQGGMPLSKGETINFHNDDSNDAVEYEVADKKIDYFVQGENQIVNVTYTFKKL